MARNQTLLALAHEANSKVNELKHTDPLMAAHWAAVRDWLIEKNHDGWAPFQTNVKGIVG